MNLGKTPNFLYGSTHKYEKLTQINFVPWRGYSEDSWKVNGILINNWQISDILSFAPHSLGGYVYYFHR